MDSRCLLLATCTGDAPPEPFVTRWDWVVATMVGVVLAVLPLELASLVAMVWFVAIICIFLGECGKREGSRAFTRVAVQVVTVIAILVAAAFAPVKSVNRLLAESVELPRACMTVREIAISSSIQGPLAKVRFITESEDMQDRKICFSKVPLPLRDFISQVEQQTEFRHHWVSCGNTATFLWGVQPGELQFYCHAEDH